MVEYRGEVKVLPIQGGEAEWIRALCEGIQKTGGLNKKAAIYTAIAVSLSTATSILSLYLASNI